jgi:hypothetical protein
MRILVTLFALLLPMAALAGEQSQCLRASEAPARATVAVNGGLTNNVLCCCPTMNGGQCCKYQSMCMGLVMGCLCSMRTPSPMEGEAATSRGDKEWGPESTTGG